MSSKKYVVEKYMSKRPVTVIRENTLKEAVEKMIQARTNGLVVVDENKKVVGILSSWDIIQYIVPDYLEDDKHLATFEAADMFEKRVKEVADVPVSKFMTAKVHSTKPHHSIMEAATLLSEFHIRQLPVVDENRVLLGYINRTDIKKAVGDVLGLTLGN